MDGRANGMIKKDEKGDEHSPRKFTYKEERLMTLNSSQQHAIN